MSKSIAWDGKKISEPGLYSGIPIEDYHADICDGISVSSGSLRTVEKECLAIYYDTAYFNPDARPREDKRAWVLGRACHTLFLGESGFKQTYVIRPDTYEDDKGAEKPWNMQAKTCKRWVAETAKAKKSWLTSTEVGHIENMAEALARHPLVRAGFLNGEIERSIFYQDPQTGLWVKNRPDNIPVSDDTLVDLKLADSVHPDAIKRSISEYGYHQQMALGGDALWEIRQQQVTDFVLFFLQHKPPYLINAKPLTQEAIWRGRQQNRRALDKIAEAIERQYWPGYDDDQQPVGLTKNLSDKLQREEEAGLLPVIE